jgi:hypothetical protein
LFLSSAQALFSTLPQREGRADHLPHCSPLKRKQFTPQNNIFATSVTIFPQNKRATRLTLVAATRGDDDIGPLPFPDVSCGSFGTGLPAEQ